MIRSDTALGQATDNWKQGLWTYEAQQTSGRCCQFPTSPQLDTCRVLAGDAQVRHSSVNSEIVCRQRVGESSASTSPCNQPSLRRHAINFYPAINLPREETRASMTSHTDSPISVASFTMDNVSLATVVPIHSQHRAPNFVQKSTASTRVWPAYS